MVDLKRVELKLILIEYFKIYIMISEKRPKYEKLSPTLLQLTQATTAKGFTYTIVYLKEWFSYFEVHITASVRPTLMSIWQCSRTFLYTRL